VRPGNGPAIALYRAYGFHEVGRRVAYYDDGEDGLIMTTESLASPPYRARLARLESNLRERFPAAAFELEPGPPGARDATRPR
jgi:ribosomal protein S18 acetylase RimI-like enzyme